MSGWVFLIGVGALGLAVLSALFSAIETALFSLKGFQIERLKERRPKFAAALGRLMENPRRLLGGILLADALVNLPLMVVCLWMLREGMRSRLSFVAGALLVFALVVFACDLVPKLLALARPVRVSRLGVLVMGALLPVFDPVVRVLQRWSERAADACTPGWVQKTPILGEEEMETLVELSAETGALHESETEMIQEIIRLGDRTARDCMTPRVDAFMVPDDLTNEELIELLRRRRHSLVPVYGETPDEIVGLLDVTGFLLRAEDAYMEHLVPPSFVSETMGAVDLLRSFLTRPQGLAVVVDEHGGVEGVITLDDLVEEIISDAVPVSDYALYIEPLQGGKVLASGRARLEDLDELLGVELREEGIDTIGGLIFNRLGAVPRSGAQLEIGGALATVRRATAKRVEEVLREARGVCAEDEKGGAS